MEYFYIVVLDFDLNKESECFFHSYSSWDMKLVSLLTSACQRELN